MAPGRGGRVAGPGGPDVFRGQSGCGGADEPRRSVPLRPAPVRLRRCGRRHPPGGVPAGRPRGPPHRLRDLCRRHPDHGGPALHRVHRQGRHALARHGGILPSALRVHEARPDRAGRLDVRRGPEGAGRSRRHHRLSPLRDFRRPPDHPAGCRTDDPDHHGLRGRLLDGGGADLLGHGPGRLGDCRTGLDLLPVPARRQPRGPVHEPRGGRHLPGRPRRRGHRRWRPPGQGPGRGRHEAPRPGPPHRLHLFRGGGGVRTDLLPRPDHPLRIPGGAGALPRPEAL